MSLRAWAPSPPPGASVRAWAPFAAVCAAVLGRVLTATAASDAPPLVDESERRAAFLFVASNEPALRREAAKTFPTDLWSRDDAFHERELRRAKEWAGTHHARVEDVLSALDEGMRDGWPHGSSEPLVATVPPCRPRAIY